MKKKRVMMIKAGTIPMLRWNKEKKVDETVNIHVEDGCVTEYSLYVKNNETGRYVEYGEPAEYEIDEQEFEVKLDTTVLVHYQSHDLMPIPETNTVPETAKNGRVWIAGNKVRYYLSGGYYEKANAFFSEKEDNAKYSWKINGGFVYADKVYGGEIENQIVADFGKIKE